MTLSPIESVGLKAFGVVAAAAGLNFVVKRLDYDNDPRRSNDPALVKGLSWILAAGLFAISYKALTLKSE
jgi:hypothetical protein